MVSNVVQNGTVWLQVFIPIEWEITPQYYESKYKLHKQVWFLHDCNKNLDFCMAVDHVLKQKWSRTGLMNMTMSSLICSQSKRTPLWYERGDSGEICSMTVYLNNLQELTTGICVRMLRFSFLLTNILDWFLFSWWNIFLKALF